MCNGCKVCDSDKHQTDFTLPTHGPDVTCRWCGKKKHWQTVCLNRLMGKPKVQNVSATTDPSVAVARVLPTPAPAQNVSASTSANSDISALRDMIVQQQQTLNEFMSKFSQNF